MIGKVLIAILVAGLLIGCVITSYIFNYQYDSRIGSYLDNAENMISPEGMIEQLGLLKQAMINEGLTEDKYGAMFFKKPDNKMDFQYKHIDGIIDRAKSIMDWQKATYNKEGTLGIENKDVLEEKMNNLRAYLYTEGRSDWIAKDAWYIENHPVWYLFGWVIIKYI